MPGAAALDEIERAFAARGAPVQIELAHLADPAIGSVLTERGYRLVGARRRRGGNARSHSGGRHHPLHRAPRRGHRGRRELSHGREHRPADRRGNGAGPPPPRYPERAALRPARRRRGRRLRRRRHVDEVEHEGADIDAVVRRMAGPKTASADDATRRPAAVPAATQRSGKITLPSSASPNPGLCATSHTWPSRSRKAPA